MPDYSKSLIYKLECKDPKITEIYVGATTNFYDRKKNHKKCCINKDGNFKWNTPVYCFMRLHGGWDNWNMLVIEEVNARNKRHLNQIEAKYIRELKAELNHDIPQDIEEGLEEKEWRRQYYAKNREKIIEQSKEYNAKNVERKKEYRENNREKIAERKKEYRENNREKLLEKAKEKIVCECGSEVTKKNLPRHKRSKKHQDWEKLSETIV